MLNRHMMTAAALAALTLTACDGADDKAGDAPAARGAPPVVAVTPKLRAGLWQVTTDGGGGPQSVSKMCLDDAVQETMNVIGGQASAGACQATTVTRRADGFAFRTTCDHTAMGGGTSVSEGVVTGDLSNSYTSVSTVTTTGAPVAHMNGAVTINGAGRHMGACPADMRPGDLEISGGMRFNMLEMAEMASKMETPAAPAR